MPRRCAILGLIWESTDVDLLYVLVGAAVSLVLIDADAELAALVLGDVGVSSLSDHSRSPAKTATTR